MLKVSIKQIPCDDPGSTLQPLYERWEVVLASQGAWQQLSSEVKKMGLVRKINYTGSFDLC